MPCSFNSPFASYIDKKSRMNLLPKMESSHRKTNSIVLVFVPVLLALLFVNCAARHGHGHSHSHSHHHHHHHGSDDSDDSTAPSESLQIRDGSRSDLGLGLGLSFSSSISGICHNTDYADVCFATLRGHEDETDTPSVLRILIQAAQDKTHAALDEVDRLESDPGSSTGLKSILSDCRDSYNDALENFQNALDAIPSSDVGSINSMLSASVTDFGDIDDFLDGYEVPLPVMNADLTHMTSNCLAVSSLLN